MTSCCIVLWVSVWTWSWFMMLLKVSSQDLVSVFGDQTAQQCPPKCYLWPMDYVSLSSFRPAPSKRLPKALSAPWCIRAAFAAGVGTRDVQQTPSHWSSAFIFLFGCVTVVSVSQWFTCLANFQMLPNSLWIQTSIYLLSSLPFMFPTALIPHSASARASCPASAFGFSAASSFLPSLLLATPSAFPSEFLSLILLTEFRDKTEFLLMQEGRKKNM